MEYEICYLIGESKEANLDKIRPGVESIIEKHKGVFLEGEFVRKRRLAYDIKGEKRGTYVARRFTVPSRDDRDENPSDYDIMGEINKELRFNQDILRYMLVKTDDLPPLKDLEVIEEKDKKEFKSQEEKKEPIKREVKIEEKKEVIVAEAKEEVIETKKEEKKEKTVKEEVKEIEEAEEFQEKEEKPKKKTKKKETETLGDDIDEKLDEILNI